MGQASDAKGHSTLARASLQEIRGWVWDLRAGPLEGLSIVKALEKAANKIVGRGTQATFTVSGKERVLPPGVEAALLRVCQEGLANMLKHANATEVTVALAFEDSNVQLAIRDNGIGIETDNPAQRDTYEGGFGLMGMRESSYAGRRDRGGAVGCPRHFKGVGSVSIRGQRFLPKVPIVQNAIPTSETPPGISG